MIDWAFIKNDYVQMTFQQIEDLIFFKQMFIQVYFAIFLKKALDEDDSSLQIIPYVTKDHILEIEDKFQKLPIISQLFSFDEATFKKVRR